MLGTAGLHPRTVCELLHLRLLLLAQHGRRPEECLRVLAPGIKWSAVHCSDGHISYVRVQLLSSKQELLTHKFIGASGSVAMSDRMHSGLLAAARDGMANADCCEVIGAVLAGPPALHSRRHPRQRVPSRAAALGRVLREVAALAALPRFHPHAGDGLHLARHALLRATSAGLLQDQLLPTDASTTEEIAQDHEVAVAGLQLSRYF